MRLPSWIGSSLIAVSFLAFAAWFLALANTNLLPDPIAIHWGLSLKADGFTSLVGYQAFTFGFLGILAAGALGVRILLKEYPILSRIIGFVFAGVYWLLLLIISSATFIQISRADARSSVFPIEIVIAILLVIPFSIWVFLDFPKISVGEKLAVSLRGIKVLEIEFSDIESVRLDEIFPKQYGGIGLRVWGKKIAFIPSKGEALILKLKSGEEVAIRVSHGDETLATVSAKTNN